MNNDAAPRAVHADDDDVALMSAFAAGDVQAFEWLYRRHHAALYRFVRRLLGRDGAAQADEVFQDTWLRVVHAKERYVPQGASFRTWLFTLAHHRAIDVLRRSGREVALPEGDDAAPFVPEGTPWSSWPRPEDAIDEVVFWRRAGAKLLECLEQLPVAQKTAFLLHHEDGITLDEISRALDIGFETAKSRLRYALSKLRTCMGAHLDAAALRHAPDHALAPPAGVSQTILNAARHVHKPARPAATPAPAVRITVAPPRAVAWLRQWFASPRLAGGLATGLVAALGLGLWIDLGREPVVDRAPPAPANEQRASDAAPVEQPVSRDRADTSSRTAELTRNVETVTPNAAHETPPVKRGANEAKVERRVERVPLQRSAPPAAAAPQRREDPADGPERALAKATPVEPENKTAAQTPQATTPTAPAPSTAPALAMADAPTGAQKAASDAVEAQRETAARSDSRMSSAAGRAAALAGARAPAGEPVAETAAAASPAFTLLRQARGETASGGARWTWMPPGKAAIVSMDAAAQDWLARVVQASRGRWTDSVDTARAGDTIEVRWWRDDWPQATLRIEADGLRWVDQNGRIRHAPLDAATLQRLRSP